MEHRLEKRVNAELSILLYNYGVPVAIGKTKNISSSGVFVETRYKPDKEDRNIEIAFVARDDVDTQFYRVNTQIVYRTQDGFGLMIDNFDPLVRLPIEELDIRNSESNRQKHDAGGVGVG